MRMIDADELLALYEGFEDMGLKVPVEVVVQSIKDMPTAYDTDKIVKQLEEMYTGFCSGLDSDICDIDLCNKYKSCMSCFYGRTLETLKGGVV